jgi:cell division septum initiation protein DivIVA
MSAEKFQSGDRPPASAAEAAQRLATIVDAAERAAASVIDDAERQAQQHLDEARDRADRLVAERLRELADELDPPGAGERRTGHLKPVEAPSEARDDDPQPQRRAGSAGARLLATQMAVSGAGRVEIEARLRSGFEIEDTGEILDAILGPEDEE